jgi:hypothetical protein
MFPVRSISLFRSLSIFLTSIARFYCDDGSCTARHIFQYLEHPSRLFRIRHVTHARFVHQPRLFGRGQTILNNANGARVRRRSTIINRNHRLPRHFFVEPCSHVEIRSPGGISPTFIPIWAELLRRCERCGSRCVSASWFLACELLQPSDSDLNRPTGDCYTKHHLHRCRQRTRSEFPCYR